MLLFRLPRTAKAKQSLATRLSGRKATPEIFLGGEFQMSRHFCIDVAVELRATGKGTQTEEELAKPRHHCCLLSSNRPTRPCLTTAFTICGSCDVRSRAFRCLRSSDHPPHIRCRTSS